MQEVSTIETYDTVTRLSGLKLFLTRLVTGVLAILSLIILVMTLPPYFTMLQATCVGKLICSPTQLTPQVAQFLLQFGISLRTYVVFNMVVVIVTILVYFGVAVVIVRRKSHDWVGLLVALMLVLLGASVIIGYLSSNLHEAFWLYVSQNAVNYCAFLLLFLVFCLFPNGKFVPRWTKWLVLCWMVVDFFSQFPLIPTPWFILFNGILSFTLLGMGVIAQVYRYRYVSTVREQQQTKWILYGIALVFLLEAALFVANILLPQSLVFSLLSVFGSLVPVLIPLSFGMAILRSHLWEIDVIINRTLVYSLLTAILAVIYVGLIIVLQILLRGVIGRTNDIANVGSTLAVAILFQPLRQRIQKGIDRFFYRRKYDVVRTLEAFSGMLRNEVDLSQLTEYLVGVVDETMQPTHTLLWLCKIDTKNEGEEA